MRAAADAFYVFTSSSRTRPTSQRLHLALPGGHKYMPALAPLAPLSEAEIAQFKREVLHWLIFHVHPPWSIYSPGTAARTHH